jgi:branched-chain amino acid transport system substrate-binding protein
MNLPIRVGFVSGLTGRHYGLGLSSRNGVTLAVEELNAAGGIGGRPLDLLVRDDEQDPAAARRAVEELVEAGVVAIIGHATSAMAEATLPIVDARRVLMISPTVSASAFERRDDWLVLLYPSTTVSGRVTARHLLSRGVRRVTAILDLSNEPYVRSWHDAFKAALEAGGGAVPRVITFTSGRVESYAALVEGAVPPGTDGVVLLANALDSATLAQQLRKRGPVQIVGSEWAFTNDVVVHGGSAVEGAIFPQKPRGRKPPASGPSAPCPSRWPGRAAPPRRAGRRRRRPGTRTHRSSPPGRRRRSVRCPTRRARAPRPGAAVPRAGARRGGAPAPARRPSAA